jgi:CRP-like cAMP-binding protein
MQPEARSRATDAVHSHPLAELLDCPPATRTLLNGAARPLTFDAGDVAFRQLDRCLGLYLVISGQFIRRAERHQVRLTLGWARPGELVELSAALGDGRHTYTLRAQTPGSMLLIPIDTLNQAFHEYPIMRMRLLAEQAREVSRAYDACKLNRPSRGRRTDQAGPA